MVHIIGHRGGRNLWIENSIEGFREVAKLPVEGVEFDVHLTRDGEMLVIHDPTLDRTTECSGPVAFLAAGENLEVRLKGDAGATIPTLDDVLDIFAGTALELHVELKADHEGKPYPGLEARAAALLDEKGMSDRSILTSFHTEVLAEIRRAAPHIRTLSSFDAKSADRHGLVEGLERMLELSDVIAIEKGVLAPHWERITELVPLDRLGVWVPNDEADISYWLGKPLRQLTTDRPDLAVALRGA
ncbi:glycerophosphodiester phosphodiesterase family protein [Aquamicrobium sp. LC103]|uniref:glycerophosphodiester phosphodiesterase family protein n=1 Tax=Aquamicrobium sp. LC103 TaxID=1120658 RepID=UPI00063E74F3|nr:glycerophosphodiester phosphodiesterase family protein [Aquamicrobium sp. LC103]TKT76284.1 glycerophosphodiester phosphodiesterase [Aquamicrobium sp. LC103]